MSLANIIVHWHGPLSPGEVRERGGGRGLYLLTGRRSYERRTQIQYCGITEGRFAARIAQRRHKVWEIREDTLAVWLGQVEYPRRFTRRHLEIAEHCLVSFWQPPLNDSKTAYYPASPVCLISQWFTADGKPRRRRPGILRDLPDVLWWDTERWRTGQLLVQPPAE